MPFGRKNAFAPPIAAARIPEPDEVFEPRQIKPWRPGVLILLGLVCLLPLAAPRSGTAIHGLYEGLAAVFFLALAAATIIGAMRGLPRLTLTTGGVKLETVFGTKTASWTSLAPFDLRKVYLGGIRRRQMSLLKARVAGADVSRNVARAKGLTIPDSFTAPLEELLARLDARQGAALPGAVIGDALARHAEQETRFGVAGFRAPWATFTLLALLVLVFVAEQILKTAPNTHLLQPDIRTLVALGGLSHNAVFDQGEWYRIFTGPLLHANLSHIALNGIALLMIGFLLEPLVGRLWFCAIFVLSTITGSLMSITINPSALVSVGASGAIMGMFAAGFAGSFRLPAGTLARSRIQTRSIRVLIPTLLPLATTASAGAVDYGAHLGGALGGGLVAFGLIKTWHDSDRLPRFRGLATIVAGVGAALFLAGIAIVVSHPRSLQAATMIPSAELPTTAAEIEARSAALAAKYPNDPRAHTYYGVALAAMHDNADAAAQFRAALALAKSASPSNTRFLSDNEALLAVTLFEEGHLGDAERMAQPLCDATGTARASPGAYRLLMNNQLCDR